jgi:hypothetical protein
MVAQRIFGVKKNVSCGNISNGTYFHFHALDFFGFGSSPCVAREEFAENVRAHTPNSKFIQSRKRFLPVQIAPIINLSESLRLEGTQ